MKKEIHPKYELAIVRCACGSEVEIRTTTPGINVEICSQCHPFFTGKQKLVDSAGRVDRFRKRYGMGDEGTTAETLSRGEVVQKEKKAREKPKKAARPARAVAKPIPKPKKAAAAEGEAADASPAAATGEVKPRPRGPRPPRKPGGEKPTAA